MTNDESNTGAKSSGVALVAEGIRTATGTVTIPHDILGFLKRGLNLIRGLLSIYGPYDTDPVPQFEDDFVLLTVRSSSKATFNAANFEEFVISVAAGLNKAPIPLDSAGPSSEQLAEARNLVARCGRTRVRIGTSKLIIDLKYSRSRTPHDSDLIYIDVSTSRDLGRIRVGNDLILIPSEEATQLRTGDVINLQSATASTTILRSVVSLVSIQHPTESISDLFESTGDIVGGDTTSAED